MICHKYNVLNSEGKLLKVIKIGQVNNRKIASDKLKALYGDNACFVKLEYAGTWTL